MNREELYSHPGWQWCTSEGAELHTLLLGLHIPFREKLEWLEEMETLTLRMRAQRSSGLPAKEEAGAEKDGLELADQPRRVAGPDFPVGNAPG